MATFDGNALVVRDGCCRTFICSSSNTFVHVEVGASV